MQLTDEQKWQALSIRYVDAARVVQLPDGTFVIFSMTRGEVVGAVQRSSAKRDTISDAFFAQELATLVTDACVRSASYWEANRRQELLRREEVEARGPRGAPPAVQVAAVNLEDLDL